MNMGINEAGDRASTEVDDFCGGSGEPAFGRRVQSQYPLFLCASRARFGYRLNPAPEQKFREPIQVATVEKSGHCSVSSCAESL
jgi:hypothetical protein